MRCCAKRSVDVLENPPPHSNYEARNTVPNTNHQAAAHVNNFPPPVVNAPPVTPAIPPPPSQFQAARYQPQPHPYVSYQRAPSEHGFTDRDSNSQVSLKSYKSRTSINTTRSQSSAKKALVVAGTLDLRKDPECKRKMTTGVMLQLTKAMTGQSQHIKSLLLSGNAIPDEAMSLLSNWLLRNRTLQVLAMSNCKLSLNSISIIAKSICSSDVGQVHTLDVSFNHLKLPAAQAIARSISTSTSSLKNLSIHHNPLSIQGVVELVRCNTLESLDCSYCFVPPSPIPPDDLQREGWARHTKRFNTSFMALCDAIYNSRSLLTLNLSRNPLDDKKCSQIMAAASGNIQSPWLAKGGLKLDLPLSMRKQKEPMVEPIIITNNLNNEFPSSSSMEMNHPPPHNTPSTISHDIADVNIEIMNNNNYKGKTRDPYYSEFNHHDPHPTYDDPDPYLDPYDSDRMSPTHTSNYYNSINDHHRDVW